MESPTYQDQTPKNVNECARNHGAEVKFFTKNEIKTC